MDQSRNTVALSKSDLILRALEREIRSGKLDNGDRLDSESRLMKRFSVSRNTIRKGLDELARQGLITKRGGIGSFVSYDGKASRDYPGSTQALFLGEEAVKTELTAIRRGSCARLGKFARSLGLPTPVPADDYLRIDRIRRIAHNRMGVLLERSRLPWRDEYQTILDNGLIEDSLNETLLAVDICVVSGKEWVNVVSSLSASDCERMERQAGEPMLELRRMTFDINGELIQYLESLMDPIRFTLHTRF